MIERINTLPSTRQRQLIRLLDREYELDNLADEDLLDHLVVVLRRSLDVPDGEDLPQYLRRRLVDVARHHFQLVDDTDTVSDLELAQLLVDFALDAAARLQDDDAIRSDFETFMRTKSRTERDKWLTQSNRLAEVMAEASGKASETHGAGAPTDQENITSALLSDLSTLSVRQPKTTPTPRTANPRLAALAAGSALSAAFAPAVAVPLGVVAGGVYMAGRGKNTLARLDNTSDDKAARAKRARRSKLVQSVVALSAFIVTSTSGDR